MSLTPRIDLIENNIGAIGDVKTSFLTEAQFQTEHDSTWILCDGRSIVGTHLASVTGWINVPDLRGQFLRGKNNGRSDGNQDPDGEKNLGQFTNDKYRSHDHTTPIHTHSFSATTSSNGAHNHIQDEHSHIQGWYMENFAGTKKNGDGQSGGTHQNAGVIAGSGITGVTDPTTATNQPAGNHTHTVSGTTGNANPTTNLNGANETAPKNIVVNYFIKINRF
jgi:hypothetical protein